MRDKSKDGADNQNQVEKVARRPPILGPTRKLYTKTARVLMTTSLALAILSASGIAFWVIHSISHVKKNISATPLNSQSKKTVAGAGANPGSPTGQPSSLTPPANSVLRQYLNQSSSSLPSKQEILNKVTKKPLPPSALLNVPEISQLPQLHNGCEITSLAMLLTYEGHPVNKMLLAQQEPQDKTPLVENDATQQIVSWGNPNVGFVGSVSGQNGMGYGIYHGPLTELANKILPNRGLDLTGSPFTVLEAMVASGTPVEVWDTTTFSPTDDWVTWNSPTGKVHATFYEHAVLLVGYNKNEVFINNPLNDEAAQEVPLQPFIEAWEQLGKQAITIAPYRFQPT